MDRRKFLVGAAATAVAGPVVAKDGVALTSMAHPIGEALDAGMLANFPNGAVIKGWMEEGTFKIKVLNWGEMPKPGRWEVTGAPARPRQDQPE